MPIVSAAQRRFFHWADAHPGESGVSRSVSKEFIDSDPGGKLPERVRTATGGGLGAPRARAQGGGGLGISMGLADPWWTRSEARRIYDQPSGGGLINSSGAGRTDQIPMAVGTESHVIPAMEVAGLGQGNTLAGARILNEALRIGPYGTPLPQHFRGPGPPSHSPPPVPGEARRNLFGYAGGGKEKGDTSVLVAGGEVHIPREDFLARGDDGELSWHAGVRTLGGGDIQKGHRVLNNMIMNIRKHTLKFLHHAPPPKS